jgi:hypothetical protein
MHDAIAPDFILKVVYIPRDTLKGLEKLAGLQQLTVPQLIVNMCAELVKNSKPTKPLEPGPVVPLDPLAEWLS